MYWQNAGIDSIEIMQENKSENIIVRTETGISRMVYGITWLHKLLA